MEGFKFGERFDEVLGMDKWERGIWGGCIGVIKGFIRG